MNYIEESTIPSPEKTMQDSTQETGFDMEDSVSGIKHNFIDNKINKCLYIYYEYILQRILQRCKRCSSIIFLKLVAKNNPI